MQEAPPLLVTLLERIAGAMRMTEGRWTLEVVFQGGRIEKWHRHEQHRPAAELARFDGNRTAPDSA